MSQVTLGILDFVQCGNGRFRALQKSLLDMYAVLKGDLRFAVMTLETVGRGSFRNDGQNVDDGRG